MYAWDSNAQTNDVGAEYIIMQKAPGIQLEQVWSQMEIGNRLEVVKQIVYFEAKWASICIKQSGSLYSAPDVNEQSLQRLKYSDQYDTIRYNENFAIGPSVGRDFYDAGRASVSFDRGPCMCASIQILFSIAEGAL